MIKLVNYPYDEYMVGDICDFGDEVNKSLAEMQRAVYTEVTTEKKIEKKKKKKEIKDGGNDAETETPQQEDL